MAAKGGALRMCGQSKLKASICPICLGFFATLCHEQLDYAQPQPQEMTMRKPALKVILAAPRGFCAGVERAIQIVEKSLVKYGAPVYVRHEIVHNKFVVEDLQRKGAVFVEDLEDVEPGRPVIFSAHGVPKSVTQQAVNAKLTFLDATCPLVSKVHMEAERHHRNGRHIVLIGHTGHPEVEGTLGQLPQGAITLVQSCQEAEALPSKFGDNLAYVTQTTLSIDDTADIISVLKKKFPTIEGPHKNDICYATTNRQEAVKSIASHCDALVVIGSANSSNSVRLVEVAKKQGCAKAMLVNNENELDPDFLQNVRTLGLTAGASAPDILVENFILALKENFDVSISESPVCKERVQFKLPRTLTAA